MSNVSVSAKDDTEMLKISVSNKDPQIAAQIANSITEVFKIKIKEIYNIENVTTIDTAIASNSPYNVNYIKNSAIFALIGAISSCGILFLLFYFNLYSCLFIFQPFSANTAPSFNFPFAVSMVTVFFSPGIKEKKLSV